MIPIFDAHLDLAWNAVQWNRDLTMPLDVLNATEAHMTDHPGRGRGTISIPELKKAHVRVCLGTILARANDRVCPANGFSRRDLDFRTQSMAYAAGQGQLAYYRQIAREGLIKFIRTVSELREHWRTSSPKMQAAPLGLILAMEGADPIVDIQSAHTWWDNGIRCVGLAHYGQGHYAMGTGADGPLTEPGRQLLREFEQLKIILDLTHTADTAFWQTLEIFSGPVMASHNLCRALVPRDRQFSDDQLRALIARDAVIGMALDAWMLSPAWKIGSRSNAPVSITAVADHIDHICQLAGNPRHVGIGSDLDGGFGTEQTPQDLTSIADLHKLEPILKSRGYSQADVDGIFFGNWLRFFERSLPDG